MGYTKGNGKELRNMAVISLTKDNFNREVMECTTKVLIDFYADWCGPCQMVSPLVDEIAGERQDIKVCKVNVDEQPALAQAFRVTSIPMLAVVENGKLVQHAVGARPKADILALLQ
jgi:thioredoxin 1